MADISKLEQQADVKVDEVKYVITVQTTIEVKANSCKEAKQKALINDGKEIEKKIVGIGIETTIIEDGVSLDK